RHTASSTDHTAVHAFPTRRSSDLRQVTQQELAHDPLWVARKLLGCEIRSTSPEGEVGVRLVEVEAYRGGDDPASHCYRGRTERKDRKSTRLNSSHVKISYAVFCLK